MYLYYLNIFSLFFVYKLSCGGLVAMYQRVLLLEWPLPPAFPYTSLSKLLTPAHASSHFPIVAREEYTNILQPSSSQSI
jgi:hypothetical protein